MLQKKTNLFFLIGMPASGKSTLGKKIAATCNYNYIDIDIEIEKEYKTSIYHLFAQIGEKNFRLVERKIITNIFDINKKTIISCGGGLPCFFDNIEQLKKNGIVIYINTHISKIIYRLSNSKQNRPLFNGIDNNSLRDKVQELYSKRIHFYNKADFIIEDINALKNILYC